MHLICTPRCNKRNAPRPHMRRNNTLRNQIVLLRLGAYQFEHERVASEVVQRVFVSGCACCFDSQHVLPRRVALWECERLGFELSVCKENEREEGGELGGILEYKPPCNTPSLLIFSSPLGSSSVTSSSFSSRYSTSPTLRYCLTGGAEET